MKAQTPSTPSKTGTHLTGLTSSQVQESRQKYGSNMFTPPLPDPEWKKLLAKFNDPTIILLLIAAGISIMMTVVDKVVLQGEGHFIDGLAILFAVGLAVTIAYLNERKSEREFELLNKEKEAINVKVTRDGKFQTIPIGDVVVGDLVHLDLGDMIPSDGVIQSSLNLIVDQSLLTGESKPIRKTSGKPGSDYKSESAFPPNQVYKGTMALDGHGYYITTEVGDSTEMGKVAKSLIKKESDTKTPLVEKLGVLANQISVGGTAAAILIFTVMAVSALLKAELFITILASPVLLTAIVVLSAITAATLGLKGFMLFLGTMEMELKSKALKFLVFLPLWLGNFVLFSGLLGLIGNTQLSIDLLNSLLLAFVIAIAIIVVAVPEGLPMMVSVSLALNMRRMALQNCLVRKLVASETIGSANVIYTDKTGTLTQNKMKPVWFYLGLRSYSAIEIKEAAETPEWDRIVQNIAINSEANLEVKSDSLVSVGNPTEGALLMLLNEHGIDYQNLRDFNLIEWQMSFNSERKMSVAMVKDDSRFNCYLKGAPELVLENCTHISIDGKPVPLNGQKAVILDALQKAAGDDALRVIAFSEKIDGDGSCHGGDIQKCLKCGNRAFLGLVGIADPLREEVPDAVAQCRSAGIDVKMITGDNSRTANAIAKQCGIIHPGDLSITSAELQQFSDEELRDIAPKIKVLSRSTPVDKLRLVQTLIDLNYVVAVTGDGTNDAPALKAADVGLSMGKSGTEVAKEASDIVILDDNFRSIVTAVHWGRALYENIQRFLQFQLSVNVVALLIVLLGPLFGVPLPFTVLQLLWINIIMDTFAGIALSTEPPRPRSMKRLPIPRKAHMISPAMMVTIGISSIYQVVIMFIVLFTDFLGGPYKLGGENELEKLTILFTVFVMFQFWHKFNCRSLHFDESPFQKLFQNPNFIVIVTIITIAQIFMVQTGGPIGELFRTTPLPLETWGWILLLTATILPVAWFARYVSNLLGLKHEPIAEAALTDA